MKKALKFVESFFLLRRRYDSALVQAWVRIHQLTWALALPGAILAHLLRGTPGAAAATLVVFGFIGVVSRGYFVLWASAHGLKYRIRSRDGTIERYQHGFWFRED